MCSGIAQWAAAAFAITSPAFMSNTPGPRATSSITVKGISARVPRGQTVSRCPMTSTEGCATAGK